MIVMTMASHLLSPSRFLLFWFVSISWVCVLVRSASSDDGTRLGGGIVTRHDVEKFADLPLDVRDIQQQIRAKQPTAALNIYKFGQNAELQPAVKFTLRSLSNELAELAVNPTKRESLSPPYLYHLYGLANREIDKIVDQALYADNFVQRSMTSGPDIAVEAIVALNLWMYAAHLLYTGIDTCRKLTVADSPDTVGFLGGAGLDEFIALWIGYQQKPATTDGFSLYAMAQMAGAKFGQTVTTDETASPEATVNHKLKLLYQEGVGYLSFPNPCSKLNPDTVQRLWSVTQRIMTQMYIPLMQLLIDAILEEDQARTSLYANALIPQISQCKPSLYKRLKEAVLDGRKSFSDTATILKDLEATYDCFGFTCNDIGTYSNGQVKCEDIPVDLMIAEYVPVTPVHDRNKIDLDVLQVKILTSLGSYKFAKQLFMFGRNSVKTGASTYLTRSLHELATSIDRENALYYQDYIGYFNSNNYANEIVEDTLDGAGKWGGRSAAQRTAMVTTTISYHIVFLYALSEMGDALKDCRSGDVNDNEGGAHAWDEVAAYLIGSLEGSQASGSADLEDGQLIWNLADRRAFQFQTLNKMGYAMTNSQLEDLLYAGRAEIDALACDNLEKTVDDIIWLVMYPMIQSVLKYAIENEDLDDSSENAGLAEGEAFTFALLPIVDRFDAAGANVIRENMELRADVQLVRDGPQQVADTFYLAFDDTKYNCLYVGASSQRVDACNVAGGIGVVRQSRSASPISAFSTTSQWYGSAVWSWSSVLGLALLANLL